MVPEAQVADGLSITLSNAAPKEPWIAVAIVITKSDHRHRVTFVKEKPFEEVFRKELVDALRPVLASFSDQDGVYSNPDFTLSLPGMSFSQLRVIYSDHGDKPSRVLVRFGSFAGNPHHALIDDDGFSHPLDRLNSKVYRDALDWVLIPALNIVSVDEVGGFEFSDSRDLETALTHLRESKQQLLYQVELVKRELGRLEAHSYAKQQSRPTLVAAEPDQEDFQTLRVIRKLD
mmetsp:Transcript_6898/g.12027  ORF Transcript_6898/g.12027 Transcript_6898/m.12027 type:complete len:232 (-) Transcript_6898:316-1011(-)